MDVGKKYKIILKNGFTYTGKIISIDKDKITLEDKNQDLIYFDIDFFDLATPIGDDF